MQTCQLLIPMGCTYHFVSTLCQLQNCYRSCVRSLPLLLRCDSSQSQKKAKKPLLPNATILANIFFSVSDVLESGGEREDEVSAFAEDRILKAFIIVNVIGHFSIYCSIQVQCICYRIYEDTVFLERDSLSKSLLPFSNGAISSHSSGVGGICCSSLS